MILICPTQTDTALGVQMLPRGVIELSGTFSLLFHVSFCVTDAFECFNDVSRHVIFYSVSRAKRETFFRMDCFVINVLYISYMLSLLINVTFLKPTKGQYVCDIEWQLGTNYAEDQDQYRKNYLIQNCDI